MFKYEKKSFICTDAFIYDEDILILTSELNNNGKLIIVKNRDNQIDVVDENMCLHYSELINSIRKY